jgi:type I restriction enzyme R subunit
VSTKQALEQLELLTNEREAADAAREKLGVPPATFALYWFLQGEDLEDPLAVANDIMAAVGRYPNHADNDDELRKLKAELYRILLGQKIEGSRMVALGEAALRLLRRDRSA